MVDINILFNSNTTDFTCPDNPTKSPPPHKLHSTYDTVPPPHPAHYYYRPTHADKLFHL